MVFEDFPVEELCLTSILMADRKAIRQFVELLIRECNLSFEAQQLPDRVRPLLIWHDISDETLVSASIFSYEYDCFFDRRMFSQRRFDLSQLDPIPSHFHL